MSNTPDTSTAPAVEFSRYGATRVRARCNGATRILSEEMTDTRLEDAAELFATTPEELRQRVAEVLRDPTPPDPSSEPSRLPEELTGIFDPGTLKVWVRGRRERRSATTPLEGPAVATFLEALERPGDFIEWPEGIEVVACLDVDFHSSAPARWPTLRAAVLSLPVRPFAFWRSHGGGLHAIFVRTRDFTAEELASAVAVELSNRPGFEPATFEVIARSRHPRALRGSQAAGEVEELEPLADVGAALDSWRRDDPRVADPEAVENFKAEKGWAGLREAPHETCPFDPRHKSRSRAPVFIGDDGVSCQSCKGRGLRHYAGWAELIDGPVEPNPTRVMASRLVDWSHARAVLADDLGGRLPRNVLRSAYFALCKVLHGADDPRIRRLRRNADGDLLRGLGCWLDPLTLRPVKTDKQYHNDQPGFCYVSEIETNNGPRVRIVPDSTAIVRAQNDGPIPGWYPVVPVRGMKLWGTFQAYPGIPSARRVVIPPSSSPAPRYIPEDDRVEELSDGGRVDLVGKAWGEIRRRFPGVSREYVELLIVARGYAESGAGPVPRILVTGPSGSAKSTTVRLAASIVGDISRSIPYVQNFGERFDAAVTEAGFLLCDEFAKPPRAKSGKKKVSNGPSFAYFLGMEDREWSARLLYIGPITLRLDSAVIVTGTGFPPGVLDDTQLARRFVHVELPSRTPEVWERTCGFGDAANTRAHLPEACDLILSDVIDRFFALPEPSTRTFADAARELGFGLIEDTRRALADEAGPDGVDPFSSVGLIRRLFELVCEGAGCVTPPARYQAKGRQKFGIFDESEIGQIWRELADDVADPSGRHRSERIDELDLAVALGLDREALQGRTVRVEIRGDHHTVCIRFIAGSGRNMLVNQEIANPNPQQ